MFSKSNGAEILRGQEEQRISVSDKPSGNTDGSRRNQQHTENDGSGRGRTGERKDSVESGSQNSNDILLPQRRQDTGDGGNRRGVSRDTKGESRGVSKTDVQRVGAVGASTVRVGLNSEQYKRILTKEKRTMMT